MSGVNRQVAARGVPWRELEILDLLEIWGEEKIQEVLRTSHRNIDCFNKVAAEMVKRGHTRSAEECRSKTKTMRLEYKKVVAHNSRSGNAPETCPYYSQLDRILHGDASVKPKRISRSIIMEVRRELIAALLELREGYEELFSHEFIGVVGPPSTTSRPHTPESSLERENREHTADSDPDVTYVDAAAIEQFLAQGGSADSPSRKENAPPGPIQDQAGPIQDQESTPPSMASQSPGSRLQSLRKRARATSEMQHVGDKMISHSERGQLREIELRERHHEDARSWQVEASRWHEEFMEETRNQRIVFQNAWKENVEIMRGVVTVLHSLNDVMCEKIKSKNGSQASSGGVGKEGHQERDGQPKRSCVGRARNRLTL